jgi:hypothetical protein
LFFLTSLSALLTRFRLQGENRTIRLLLAVVGSPLSPCGPPCAALPTLVIATGSFLQVLFSLLIAHHRVSGTHTLGRLDEVDKLLLTAGWTRLRRGVCGRGLEVLTA